MTIAMLFVGGQAILDVVARDTQLGAKIQALPGMCKIADGKISLKKLQDIQIEDPLGRQPVYMDMGKIGEYLADRKVLITWARSDTKFTAMRFGNMLGSHGGVVPLFGKQISEDEFVTVTSFDVTRCFMTVSEAVQLVIQIRRMARPERYSSSTLGSE